MRLQSLKTLGLKGGEREHVFTSQRVLVVGENGSGKSSIPEAIDFALGRAVGGYDTDKGRALLGLLSGGRLSAEARLIEPSMAIDAMYTGCAIYRSRVLDGDTFKEARLTVNGVAAANLDAALGDTSGASGGELLAMSPDKLKTEMATLAAVVAPLEPWVVDALLALAKKLETAIDVARPGQTLTDVRAAAEKRVSAARKAKTTADATAEASRKLSPESPPKPDEITNAQTRITSESAKLNAWLEARGPLVAAMTEAQAVVNRHSSAATDMAGAIEQRSQRLAALGPAEAPGTLAGKIEAAKKKLASAEKYATDTRTEAKSATAAALEASMAESRARSQLEQVRANKALLEHGMCPTCLRAAPPTLLQTFDDAIEAKEAEHEQTLGLVAGAREYAAECEAETQTADMAKDDAVRLTGRLSMAASTSKQAETLTAEIAELRTRLHTHRAALPPSPADAARALAEYDVTRPAFDLQAEQAKVRGLTERRAAYDRWRADLKARELAESAVESARVTVQDLNSVERHLATTGATLLIESANCYLPHGWRVLYDPEGLGVFALTDERGTWYGPGVSTSQRAILTIALDAALGAIHHRRFKYLCLDADPLSPATLPTVRDAIDEDIARGVLDFALVMTCHRPARAWDGWQVIETSEADNYGVSEIERVASLVFEKMRAEPKIKPAAVTGVDLDLAPVCVFDGGELVGVIAGDKPIDMDAVHAKFARQAALDPADFDLDFGGDIDPIPEVHIDMPVGNETTVSREPIPDGPYRIVLHGHTTIGDDAIVDVGIGPVDIDDLFGAAPLVVTATVAPVCRYCGEHDATTRERGDGSEMCDECADLHMPEAPVGTFTPNPAPEWVPVDPSDDLFASVRPVVPYHTVHIDLATAPGLSVERTFNVPVDGGEPVLVETRTTVEPAPVRVAPVLTLVPDEPEPPGTPDDSLPWPASASARAPDDDASGEPPPTPRDFGPVPNLFRVRGVIAKLGREARAALKAVREGGSASDIPPAHRPELVMAGFLDADACPTAAGGIAVRMIGGEAVDGVALEAEPPPPPAGAGVSEKDAKKIIRELAPGTDALRSITGPAKGRKMSGQVALDRAAALFCQRGETPEGVRAAVALAVLAFPKRARKANGAADADGDDEGTDGGEAEDASNALIDAARGRDSEQTEA